MTRPKRLWTEEEVATLTELATSSTAQDFANLFDRPIKMIRWKADQLGLALRDGRKDNPGRTPYVWTDESLAYLREHAAETPALVMATHLGLTEKQVRQALSFYSIEGRGVARTHTPEEVEIRVAPLRGVEKVDRSVPRRCSECGELKPIHMFPSETSPQTLKCKECRILHGMSGRYTTPVSVLRQMLVAQNHACALCKVTFNPDFKMTSMAVDHDHRCCSTGGKSCGKCVRSLLCHGCNVLEGLYSAFLARGGSLDDLRAYVGDGSIVGVGTPDREA